MLGFFFTLIHCEGVLVLTIMVIIMFALLMAELLPICEIQQGRHSSFLGYKSQPKGVCQDSNEDCTNQVMIEMSNLSDGATGGGRNKRKQ